MEHSEASKKWLYAFCRTHTSRHGFRSFGFSCEALSAVIAPCSGILKTNLPLLSKNPVTYAPMFSQPVSLNLAVVLGPTFFCSCSSTCLLSIVTYAVLIEGIVNVDTLSIQTSYEPSAARDFSWISFPIILYFF